MLTCLGRHNVPVLCTKFWVCPIITTAQARCLPKQCRTKRHQQYTVVACSCQSGKCCLDVYCTRLCGTSLYEPRCSLELYRRHVYCTRERPSPYQRNNKSEGLRGGCVHVVFSSCEKGACTYGSLEQRLLMQLEASPPLRSVASLLDYTNAKNTAYTPMI